MTNRDGAGNTAFKAFRSTASGAKENYAVVPVSPASGDRYPSLGVTLTVNLSGVSAGNFDVPWQVATDAAFSSLVYSSTSINVPQGLYSIVVSGLTAGTMYYWRARAAPTGTTTWGAYSPTWIVTPDSLSGNAAEYIHANVGADYPLDPDVTAAAYVDLNAGAVLPLDPDVTAAAYVDWNVGAEITLDPDAVEYAHYGDVNTLTPTPHIWFLKPSAGRGGDGITIICFGAGDLQATFSGQIEVFKGAVWVPVSVTNWQTFLPTVHAYDALRQIDEALNIIDMQHTAIEITVPADSIPPGYPIRIRTNGA